MITSMRSKMNIVEEFEITLDDLIDVYFERYPDDLPEGTDYVIGRIKNASGDELRDEFPVDILIQVAGYPTKSKV